MRVGLVGTGYWARETHATALSAEPTVTLAGVWGRDPAKTRAVAEGFDIRAYADLDELVGDVDAVSLAVPPDVQAPLAVTIATKGRHLLLDKPIAFSTEEADQVVAAVGRAGVASVVFFTQRFVSDVADWIDRVAHLGGWHAGNVTVYSAALDTPGGPYNDSAWRRRKGPLWDIGPHALALVLPVLGPVEHAAALTGGLGATQVTMRHRSGASSTLSLSLTMPTAAAAAECVFHGRHGVEHLPASATTPVESMRSAARELLAAVDGKASACDGAFGRDVVAVLEAAERGATAYFSR